MGPRWHSRPRRRTRRRAFLIWQVSLDECVSALSALELGLSNAQIQQLVSILGFGSAPAAAAAAAGAAAPGGDATLIDLESYLKRLAIVADHTVIARTEQEKRDLQQIAKWIEAVAGASGISLSALFKRCDTALTYGLTPQHLALRPLQAV